MELVSIFLNRIMSEAARRNAQVLHLVAGSKPTMKIDGELVALEEELVSSETAEQIAGEILSQEEHDSLKSQKEISTIKIFGGSFRFRVNVYYQKSLVSLSFYYISSGFRSLKELSLPKNVLEFLRSPQGLFIVAGPFGSGKTSTIAALIEEINKDQKKIIVTIEDPIEYVFISKKSLVNQRQLGNDAPDMNAALDYCLAEDVDIIYINQHGTASRPSLKKVLELASGNALVFWEMEGDSVVKVIQEIATAEESKPVGDAIRYNLADVLLTVVVQRLIPMIGGGLALANEILVANDATKSLIREGKIYQLDTIIQTSRQEGMISLEKSLEELYMSGRIDRGNAAR